MIRYALAPIAILCVLTAWAVVEFSRAGTRLVRWSVFAACYYALLFSLCGIAINEANRTQLRYFARHVFMRDMFARDSSEREYLRAILVPYRALQFLDSAVKPGEAVLCVNSCAAAYLKDSTPVSCYLLDHENPWKGARAMLSSGSFRFAVVPRAHALDVPPGWTEKYADESFSVLAR